MHEAEFDHDHEEIRLRGVDVEGLEKLSLTSVGIDIGSSTSQVLFSQLTLRRDIHQRGGEFKVADRRVLWASPVMLTPYRTATVIDFDLVREFIHQCYHAVDLGHADIDTGVVVITGEALKKENARPIVEHFARGGGKFLCASAGPHHEALLAAHGSGSVAFSRAHGERVLNVDIGGGTTKLSLVEAGQVVETAAISLGARLIAFDAEGRVSRIEEAGRRLAEEAGVPVALGDVLEPAQVATLGEFLADVLAQVLQGRTSPLISDLMVTPPLKRFRGLADTDHVIVSGGVSEYVYGRTDTAFGDLGQTFGAKLRGFLDSLPKGTLLTADQGIRATVIGASEYTIQVSGSTSFLSDPAVLPVRGAKVIRVHHHAGEPFNAALAAALARFDVAGFGPGMVIALDLAGELAYRSLRGVAEGLADFFGQAPGLPALIAVEQDVAKVLGRLLKTELEVKNEVLCIDGITVGDLDYIDIGAPISMLEVFPVTVKSLLFPPPPHLHH